MGGALIVTPCWFDIRRSPAAAVSVRLGCRRRDETGRSLGTYPSSDSPLETGALDLGGISARRACRNLAVFRVRSTSGAEETLRTLIGLVVLVALPQCSPTVGGTQAAQTQQLSHIQQGTDMPVRVIPTVLMGALVGLLVGLTSVGSGSLVVTVLLLMYPLLRPSVLVGN